MRAAIGVPSAPRTIAASCARSPALVSIPSSLAAAATAVSSGAPATAKSCVSSSRWTRTPRARASRPCAPCDALGRLLGHPQHPFEVVAVPAPLQQGERGVAERRREAGVLLGAPRRRRRRLGRWCRLDRARRARQRRAGPSLRRLAQDPAVGRRAAQGDPDQRPAPPAGRHGLHALACGCELRKLGAQRRAEPADRGRGVAFLRPRGEVHGAAQQQALAGPRHRDVEDAALLLALAGLALGTQLIELERLHALPRAGAPQPQADARAVDEQPVVGARPFAPEVRDAHDRELEPLGGMDRHQADGVGLDVLDGRVGLRSARASELLDVVDEGAQVAPLGRLEGVREAQQLVDVREPALRPVERDARGAGSRSARGRARAARRCPGPPRPRAPARTRRRSRRAATGPLRPAPPRPRRRAPAPSPIRPAASARRRSPAGRARRGRRRPGARRAPRTAPPRRAGSRAPAGSRAGR